MKTSVVAVTTHVLFTSNSFGGEGQPSQPSAWVPVPNGLFDPRMGSTDPLAVCPTCNKTGTLCPGHYGHIPLAFPLFGNKVRRLPVPPPMCRPFRRSSQKLTHHKLTQQMGDIVVLNERLKRQGSSRGLGRLEQAVSIFLHTWLVESIRV